MAALTFGVLAAWAPATAVAGGCEVLQDPRDRAECTAREVAREEARAEVARQVDASDPGSDADRAAGDDRGRSAAWTAATAEANAFDPTELLEPRPIAAVGGLVWFLLIVRSRRRARARARS